MVPFSAGVMISTEAYDFILSANYIRLNCLAVGPGAPGVVYID